jgi:cAMP phosphodiesterase
MIIRVLGCHGSELTVTDSRGRTHECKACGFLVNQTCMVDAGTVSAGLLEIEQDKIRHVLLSHSHFDHIKGVPLLADNMAGRTTQGPITVWSLPEVLQNLRRHIFNDEVYPDFTRLPNAADAPLVFEPLLDEKPVQFDGLEVIAIRVNHTVPTAGFIVRDGESAFLYSGDTGETERIWEFGQREPRLKGVFIETSFPNDQQALAKVSGHLTPQTLSREVLKLGRPNIPLYIYHLKPSYREQIESELKRLALPNLQVLQEGQVIVL